MAHPTPPCISLRSCESTLPLQGRVKSNAFPDSIFKQPLVPLSSPGSDRAIQYSRDGRARADGPRVTGCPACAGHDEWKVGRVSAFSPRILRPSCASASPSENRGRREGRVAAAPGALAPKKLREGRVTTGTGGDTPAFPARWFTAYFELSPVNQRLPPSSA